MEINFTPKIIIATNKVSQYPNIDPPYQEDKQTTIPVYIPSEVVIINGEESYWIANENIAEMSDAVLRELVIELMKEARCNN